MDTPQNDCPAPLHKTRHSCSGRETVDSKSLNWKLLIQKKALSPR
ncbi:hypothetical protein [Enterobacter sp. UNJFSC 003]